MEKIISLILICFTAITLLQAQIGVDATHTYLITKKDGNPFFWLGDTSWELFHRLTREEAIEYLDTRKKQKFNVIMAVALAELNGLCEPNLYGDVPFKSLETLEWATTPGNNPKNTDEYDYWDNMDFVIREAAKRDMYIGLLPTWGDGPMIFNNNPDGAYNYTRKLAERYKKQWNIIWILGGDRPAIYQREGREHDERPVWRAMARAIEEVYGYDVFITYHPGWPETFVYFQNEEWLDMHALQSGHGSRTIKAWETIRKGLELESRRPMMDLEPCYEDHPVNPWDGKWTREGRGYFDDYDVRARIYRGVFAGGSGAVYGHHHVWQFLDTARNKPVWIGDSIFGWRQAINAKGASHIHHLKDLMLSHSDFNRTEDSTLIVSERGDDYTDAIIATRNRRGTYAMVYLPQPRPVVIDLDKLKEGRKKISWFNPVTGKYKKIRKRYRGGVQSFTPPNVEQRDWVLVIDVK